MLRIESERGVPTMDYTRYYTPVLVQIAAYAGFALGGNWVFIGIASLPLLGLIDSVLPNDMRPREMKRGLMADLPVWLATILAVGLYFMAAFWVRSSEAITPWQYAGARSEEHTSELQSLMRTSYAVFCLKQKNGDRTTLSIL